VQILESNKHLLNEQQRRLLERSLKNCAEYGTSLNETDIAIGREINSKIQQEQKSFKYFELSDFSKFELKLIFSLICLPAKGFSLPIKSSN